MEAPGLGSFSFPKSYYCFWHQSKSSNCPKQSVQMWLTLRDCATGTKEVSVIPRTLMLLSLTWYDSSCCLRDPRENEQFILCLKSKGSCEKRMWHTKVILRGELLLPGPQNGMWERVTKQFDLSTQTWLLNTTCSSTHVLDNRRMMWPILNLPAIVPSIGNHYYGGYEKIIKIKQVTKRSRQVWPWIIRFLMHRKATNNNLPWRQKCRCFSCRQNWKETHCFPSVFNFQYRVCNELLTIIHYAIRVLHIFTYK